VACICPRAYKTAGPAHCHSHPRVSYPASNSYPQTGIFQVPQAANLTLRVFQIARATPGDRLLRRSRKLLHLYLMALENCSFACAENEAYVVGLPVGQGGKECTMGACLVIPPPQTHTHTHFPPPPLSFPLLISLWLCK